MSEPRRPFPMARLYEALWFLKDSRYGDDAEFPTLPEVRVAFEATFGPALPDDVSRLTEYGFSRDRLILLPSNLADFFGTRNENGDRITFEWGEPDEHGWYTPTVTTRADDNLVSAERERNAELVEALARLVNALDNGVNSDASMWATLDREIDAALVAARRCLQEVLGLVG